MDKGLCASMFRAISIRVDEKLRSRAEARRQNKKSDQPQAKKASENDQEVQEEKSTQVDEKKKKRRKNPKKLTPEEIAVKVAEGMKRRAKKKPPPPKDDRKVPWFHQVRRQVRRRNDWPICDKKAVLDAATMAEALRPEFEKGPVTLRQLIDHFAW